MYKKTLSIFGLVVVGVLGRLLPHLPNATPVTAVTFAARKHVGRAWVFIVPLLAMLVSDFFIGFYDWKILISVYGSFLGIGLVSLLIKKDSGPLFVGLLTLASSLLFFLVTNFAVWLYSPWYPKSFAGLLYCYALGLPFLRNMALGDMVYTAALLGTFSVFSIVKIKTRQQIALLAGGRPWPQISFPSPNGKAGRCESEGRGVFHPANPCTDK